MAKQYTLEEMRQAIIETGLSFYRHDPCVQYDSNPMTKPFGWKIRRCDSMRTAETAAPDEMLYTVCSDFVYRVYREATGFLLAPNSSLEYWTASSTRTPADDPISVYKYGDDDGEQNMEKALAESEALLQPGDAIIYFIIKTREDGTVLEGGHCMLYLGDYFGDGKKYIAHSEAPGGGKFDIDTGFDKTEPFGSISLQTTDEICFHPEKQTARRRYLGIMTRFVIHRPLDVLRAQGYTLTDAAVARLRYKGLTFWKTLDRSRFADVRPGCPVTVTLSVTNLGKEPYRGLPLEDPLPAGQKLVSVTGGGVEKDGSLRWSLDVEPGQSAAVTYTVIAQGQPGDVLVFPAGTVAEAIPTREITLKVGGMALTPPQEAKLGLLAVKLEKFPFYGGVPEYLTDGSATDLDAVNRLYRDHLGVEIHLPKTARELLEPLLELREMEGADEPMIVLKDGAKPPKCALERHLAGKYYYDGPDMSRRVLEYYERNYTPGDVFVCVTGDSRIYPEKPEDLVIQVYLGDGKVLTITNGSAEVGEFADTIGLNLRMNFLIALRPTIR